MGTVCTYYLLNFSVSPKIVNPNKKCKVYFKKHTHNINNTLAKTRKLFLADRFKENFQISLLCVLHISANEHVLSVHKKYNLKPKQTQTSIFLSPASFVPLSPLNPFTHCLIVATGTSSSLSTPQQRGLEWGSKRENWYMAEAKNLF